MPDFKQAIKHIGDDDFLKYLKTELEQLGHEQLPMQAGLSNSSYVTDTPYTAVILGSEIQEGFILVRAGLFYTGIIAGCSCADDPGPIDEINEYCEIELLIEKTSGNASIKLL